MGIEYSDTFTYADNASLATASSGAWLDAGGTAVWSVLSNEARYRKSASGFVSRITLTNTNMSSANHYVEADLRFTTFTNAQGGVCLRGAVATDGSCVEAMIDGTNFRIRTRTNGTATNIAGPLAHGLTAPVTLTMRLEAEGTAIHAEIVGAGKELDTTSSTHQTNVKCGLLGISQFDGSVFVDNFEAGTLGAVAVDIVPADVVHLQEADAAVVGGTVIPDGADHLQVVDESVVAGAVLPDDVVHTQVVDTVVVSGAILPAAVVHTQVVDTGTVTLVVTVVPNDVVHAQQVESGSAGTPSEIQVNIQFIALAPQVIHASGVPELVGNDPGAPALEDIGVLAPQLAHSSSAPDLVDRGPGAPVLEDIGDLEPPILADRSADVLLFHGDPGDPVI